MFSSLRTRFKDLQDAQEGNVIMLVALGAFMLVIAAGTAIDMARAEILQIKISSALDAAGLAAGAATLNVPKGVAPADWVQQQAQRYFNANFPSGYLESNPTINVTTKLSNGGTTVDLTASTQQTTSFMPIIGVNKVTVSAASQISRGVPITTELVLALDNTGSMANPVNPADSTVSKMDALKGAATSLVNILNNNNGDPTLPSLFIGLVPFSETVNVTPARLSSWIRPSDISNKSPAPTGTGTGIGWGPPPFDTVAKGWAGCVDSREYPMDVTDDAPDAGNETTQFPLFWFWPFTPFDSTINNWVTGTLDVDNDAFVAPYSFAPGSFTTTTGTTIPPSRPFPAGGFSTTTYGPNLFCPEAMIPMTANQDTILTGINNMVSTGDTDIDIGAAWGWRMLSPKWTGKWGGDMNTFNLPRPYYSPTASSNSMKVMVLMSDGWNHVSSTNYTAYGTNWDAAQQTELGTFDVNQQAELLDARTKWVCDSLKHNGVFVYTIAFGVDDDESNPTSANYALLKYCATDPAHFFAAPTNKQLQKAFQTIANTLVNLRVSQ